MPILQWLNKDDAVRAAQKSAYRVLEEVPELSYGDKDNGVFQASCHHLPS